MTNLLSLDNTFHQLPFSIQCSGDVLYTVHTSSHDSLFHQITHVKPDTFISRWRETREESHELEDSNNERKKPLEFLYCSSSGRFISSLLFMQVLNVRYLVYRELTFSIFFPFQFDFSPPYFCTSILPSPSQFSWQKSKSSHMNLLSSSLCNCFCDIFCLVSVVSVQLSRFGSHTSSPST